MSYDFPSHFRLLRADDFLCVFRLRPISKTRHFFLYVRRETPSAYARLGISVINRFAKRAVTRNMIKRLCREIFRQTPLPPIDCIIRLSCPINSLSDPAVTASLKRTVQKELRLLFASIS